MATLCDSCNRMLQKRLQRARIAPQTMIASQNCRLCALMLQAFELNGHQELMQSAAVGDEIGTVGVFFESSYSHRLGSFEILKAICYLPSHDHNPKTKSAAPIAMCKEEKLPTGCAWLERSDASSISMMRSWLENCNNVHKECSLSIPTTPTLPTRIIDVGDDIHDPFLFVSNGNLGSYATLSHCWGNYVPLTTTKVSLQERLQAIPLASLPQTFRDAVLITRGLGLQYLWIDSLCVIQDDQTDWEVESGSMASVYQSSHVTLSAAAAKDATVGCFSYQDTSTAVQYSTRHHRHALRLRPVASDTRALAQSNLNQRAWALQESLLSRRIIWFAEDQIYWQCGKYTESEDGTFHTRHEARGPWKVKYYDKFRANLSVRWLATLRETLRKSWWEIVEDYSSRKLTYADDKLAAFAGVTIFYQERSGETPLVGLWLEDFAFGLLWDVQNVSDSRVYGPPYISPFLQTIPTWSWMHVDTPITAPISLLRNATRQVEVIGRTLTWSGRWLSSRILGASITVRARITPIILALPVDQGKVRLLKPLTWHRGRQDSLKCNRQGLVDVPRVLGFCSLNKDVIFELDNQTFGKLPKLSTVNAWALQVFVNEAEDPSWSSPIWNHVLILEPNGSNPSRDDWIQDNRILLADSAGNNGGILDIEEYIIARVSRGLSSYENIEMKDCDLGRFQRIGIGKINGHWGSPLSTGENVDIPKKMVTLV